MKIKRKLILIAAMLSSVALATITVFGMSDQVNFNICAEESIYDISFNESKNKFHSNSGNVAYDGDATILTDLGNEVNFSYYQVMGGLFSTWHILGDGGYFYNTTPITGMKSITIGFKTDNASYAIYYSYDDSLYTRRGFISQSSTTQTFNFNNSEPCYFKLINTSGVNLNISSISIELSCVDRHSSLSVAIENEDMGTVCITTLYLYSSDDCRKVIKAPGEEIWIHAYPKDGFRFIGWYNGNNLISTRSNEEIIMGYEDVTYTARFAFLEYNLLVSSESEDKGTVDNSSGTYEYLENITTYATPQDGYTFEGWYSGDTLISRDNPYTFNMPHNNVVLTAKFSALYYDLNLVNNNIDLGSVTGSGTFAYNSKVIIRATPKTGATFLGWYDENNSLVSKNYTYLFNMPHENIKYVGKFAQAQYKVDLTVNDETKGTVSGSGSYLYDQQVTLQAYPEENCSFIGWYNGNKLLSQEETYIFNMPNKSVKYEAKFATVHNLNIFSEDENMGTVTGPNQAAEGISVTVKALKNKGYSFVCWYDESLNEVSRDATYTFTMPARDYYLIASFSRNSYNIVYYLNGGTNNSNNPTNYTVEDNITLANPTKPGYTFKGWDSIGSNGSGIIYSIPEGTTGTVYLSARWVANLNNLSVTSEDDSKGTVSIISGSGYTDETIVVEANPNSKCKFVGWYNGNKLVSSNTSYSFVMPASDYSLVAHFIAKTEEEIEDEWNRAHGFIPAINTTNNTIAYGTYPQSNVDDSALLAELNKLTTPESNGWYKYEDEYYAKLSAHPSPLNGSSTFDNGSTIVDGTTYWFKCEPIVWNILVDKNNGTYYLITEKLLDVCYYYNDSSNRTIDDVTVYPNNYQYSEIRALLNGYDGSNYGVNDYGNQSFLSTAFCFNSSYIWRIKLDNSAATTNSSSNPYACAACTDNVFPPTYKDYTNSAYGFSTTSEDSPTRGCKTTDYARANGAIYVTNRYYTSFLYNGCYWTRSPSSYDSNSMWIINGWGGLLCDDEFVTSSGICIRPSLFIRYTF